MKRLIYAPKAYIFIRSSNLDGQIFDVSSDIVNGSVTRKLGDVSTAQWVLRNRSRKWLRDPNKQSIFLPMDLVTIWLQRISGFPIQVFTGYLDSVPYYQLYPGNCSFTGSCTLKRLAFQWFDPGLEFFQNWMRSEGGFTYNPSTGDGLNKQLQAAIAGVGDFGKQQKNISDGGFAKLLYDFLTGIAGWGNDDVLISDLPADIAKRAATLYRDINDTTASDLQGFAALMGSMMGVNYTPSDSYYNTDGSTTPAQAQTTKAIAGGSPGVIPLKILNFAGQLLTGYNPGYNITPDQDPVKWGFGVFAMRPNDPISANSSNPAILDAGTIDGTPVAQIFDAGTASTVFSKRLLAVQGNYLASANNGNVDAMVQWISTALGRPIDTTGIDLQAYLTRASQVESSFNVGSGSQTTQSTSTTTSTEVAATTWTSANLTTLLSAAERKTAATRYAGRSNLLAAHLFAAKTFNPSILLSFTDNPDPNTLYLGGPVDALQAYFNAFSSDSTIDTVILAATSIKDPKTQVLVWGVASTQAPALKVPANTLAINDTGKLNSAEATLISGRAATGVTGGGGAAAGTAPPPSKTPGGDVPYGVVSLEQLGKFSANAAFAAKFAFPTSFLESHALTGKKALMNDYSCLAGVKQFCQASMRTFMSLPDGRFLAFYPDYFGSKREPYWWIGDMEITNMGIQLNDSALATHVYVIGDTMGTGTIDVIDEASTRGVATIVQAFILNTFIEPYTQNQEGIQSQRPLGKLASAYDFLIHYGARPHREDYPIIRNTFFEFLIAWQRFMQLWASQFATLCEFTFQPEIMAGGILGFQDHRLQMFVEEVTHTFDYTAGFSSQATLSAPALLKGTKTAADEFPGFALAGNINSVGAV